jgi:hypothetical protein
VFKERRMKIKQPHCNVGMCIKVHHIKLHFWRLSNTMLKSTRHQNIMQWIILDLRAISWWNNNAKAVLILWKAWGDKQRQLQVSLGTSILFGSLKTVLLQAWSGPEGSGKLRFPDFMTMAQDGGKVVSLTHQPPLPPGNTPGTHFC